MVYQITLSLHGIEFDMALRAPSRLAAMRIVMNAAARQDAADGHETKVVRIVEANELESLLQSSLD